MSKARGATRQEDEALGCYEEGLITSVEPYGDGRGWSVLWGNGYGCGVRDVGVVPKVGDVLRTYGGFGYEFHGQDLNGHSLWYLTPEEEERERQRRSEEEAQRKRDRFEQDRSRLDADYDSLPETFKERIDKFRKTNPDWRWQFESYEMMCCKDALKIASYCSVNRLTEECEGDEPTAAENVVAYSKLTYEEQKKAGIDGGHSGNSFGLALRLAYLWVTQPSLVIAEHGALTSLVGCKDYGCPHPDEAV